MSFLTLLFPLAEKLLEFLILRIENLKEGKVEKSEKIQSELIKQIEIERGKKTQQSTAQADFLSSRLRMEKEKYEKLIANL